MSKQPFCPHKLCRPVGHGGACLSIGVNLKPGPGQVGWAGSAPDVANRQPRQPTQLPFSPEEALPADLGAPGPVHASGRGPQVRPSLPSLPTPALALPSEFSKSQSSIWTRTKATAAPAQATRRAAWKAPGSSRKPESPTPPRKPQGQASPNTPGCGRVCLPVWPLLPGHRGLSTATPEPTCPQVGHHSQEASSPAQVSKRSKEGAQGGTAHGRVPGTAPGIPPETRLSFLREGDMREEGICLL